MSENALLPLRQKQVVFYDDELTAVLVRLSDQEQVFVPIRPLSAHLDLDWSAQFRRINRDPVLAETVQGVAITTTPSPDGRGGGQQAMVCLPLKYLPGWLFGINANRVKAELRDKIIRYKRECYDVLWEAFQEGRLMTAGNVSFDELLRHSESEAVEAYKMLQAMVKLARNQIVIESRLDHHDGRLADYEMRLEAVETILGDPGHQVTPDQAMQISQAVKVVALEVGKKTKKNEYGAIYGQLYREFGITSYKQLPANQFDRALTWLTEWYSRVTGATSPDDVPF